MTAKPTSSGDSSYVGYNPASWDVPEDDEEEEVDEEARVKRAFADILRDVTNAIPSEEDT